MRRNTSVIANQPHLDERAGGPLATPATGKARPLKLELGLPNSLSLTSES